MSEIENDYQTASGFSSVVAFIGWIAILLMGLLLVVSAQSLQAQLDTANYSKKLLEAYKNQ